MFHIKWGEFRDTDDIEGKVIESNSLRPTNSQIISALPFFIGNIKQKPSRFSAIKINGQRAYKLARKNIKFEIKEREIKIFFINLVSNSDQFAEFEVECSKGTYIRSLSRDLCERIGVCGYVSNLTRLMVGKFFYQKRIPLDLLKLLTSYGGPVSLGSCFY